MLTLYKRHGPLCRQTDRNYKKCKCPMWVQGTLAGEPMRQSLKVRSWEKAEKIIFDWQMELEGVKKEEPEAVTIKSAVADFLKDAEARSLSEATIVKLKGVLERQFVEYCREQNIKFLTELGVEDMRKFRATWKDQPLSAVKKLERLRSFFRFCVDAGWMPRNPALAVKPPKVPPKATMPFTSDKIEKILRACDAYFETYPKAGKEYCDRIKALVLLMRYSGLRIRDAVCLKRDKIENGRLFLYTQKSGTPVYLPLPPVVLDALSKLPPDQDHYFWSGQSTPKAVVGDWQRTFRKLFTIAGVKGHPHMFRNTFAISLLEKGVSIETVSVLLGHRNIRVTQSHYNAWVKSRQELLESAVMKTW
jgi:integrase/recombinase XerD